MEQVLWLLLLYANPALYIAKYENDCEFKVEKNPNPIHVIVIVLHIHQKNVRTQIIVG